MNIETYVHDGVRVRILQDEYADSHCDPRDADNLGKMLISYRGNELGDEQLPKSGLPHISCPRCEGKGYRGTENACERCEGLGEVEPTTEEWLEDQEAIAVMPLFLLDHSGLSIRGGEFIWLDDPAFRRPDGTLRAPNREWVRSTNRFAGDSAGWDTSFVGFLITTEERVRELCGDDAKYRTAEFLAEAFKVEIEEYDKFLRGEVYGYIVGEDTPPEESCWGFLGFDYVKEQANETAECIAKQLAAEANKRAGRDRKINTNQET